MRTITKDLYQYDELSDKAKEVAANWYREASAGDNFFAEFLTEDFATICQFCGWDINQRLIKLADGKTSYAPSVFWSGFSCQGDGACFEGDWNAEHVRVRELKKHAPKDKELARIAREFRRLANKKRHATATSKHVGRYCHSNSVDIQAHNDANLDENFINDLATASRALMNWFYRELEKEYEYQYYGKGLEETMRTNEYEFDISGRRA